MGKRKEKKKAEIDPIRCVWGLLCSLSSIDQEKNNISLFNVIEQVNLPKEAFSQQLKEKKPLSIPFSYEIILLWRRTLNIKISDEEIATDIKINITDPSNKVIQELIVPLQFPKGKSSLRYRVNIPVLTFTTTGDYTHQIELRLSNSGDFKKIIEIPFAIGELPIQN